MRSFHRMDIGVDFIKEKRNYTRTWNIGVYNAYNRKNPFFIFIDTDPILNNNGARIGSERVLKQASLFPLIPSFSYKIEF